MNYERAENLPYGFPHVHFLVFIVTHFKCNLTYDSLFHTKTLPISWNQFNFKVSRLSQETIKNQTNIFLTAWTKKAYKANKESPKVNVLK